MTTDPLEQRLEALESLPSMTESQPPNDEDEDPYRLVPLDWQALIKDGIPEIDYLDPPYIVRGARTWFWGATGTSKSIYALWIGCRLSRQGRRVVYFSEENPTAEDLRRLALLQPDPDFFAFYHRTGIDLTDPNWIAVMLEVTAGCDVVVFDTWTDLWHGDENSNEEVRNFDANVLKKVQAQGGTPIIVHHSGHQVMFAPRKGAAAGRGASSLGQKADVTLEFKLEDDDAFTIVYGKARIGGQRQPDHTFKVVDTDDGIDIIDADSGHVRHVQQLAEKMAQAILTAPKGYLTTSQVRAAAGGSSATQRDAFELLADDDRVRTLVRKAETSDGKWRNANVWEPAEGGGGMFE